MRARAAASLIAAILGVILGVILAAGLAACAGSRETAEHGSTTDASVTAATLASDSAFSDSLLRAAEDIGAAITEQSSANPAPTRDPLAISNTLRAYAEGTYISELFAARDSVNYRWPDRTRDPLRVFIQRSTLAGFSDEHRTIVRDAFDPWTDVGIPVTFDFTDDSARADIHITWVDRYESRTTGRTRWVHDQHGWITGAGIEIALSQPDGRALDAESLRAIARHEIGHLLGLEHTADETNIMSARVRVSELSEADRATVRLVYKLPPGSVRAP